MATTNLQFNVSVVDFRMHACICKLVQAIYCCSCLRTNVNIAVNIVFLSIVTRRRVTECQHADVRFWIQGRYYLQDCPVHKFLLTEKETQWHVIPQLLPWVSRFCTALVQLKIMIVFLVVKILHVYVIPCWHV